MTAEDIEYDLRQIKILQKLLEEASALSSASMINRLIVESWALLDLMKQVDGNWIQNYRSHVNAVEDIYAFAAAEERPLSLDEQNSISVEVDKMKALILFIFRTYIEH